MHYADNVDYPPLLRRPIVFLPALALLFELLRWWNIGATAMGRGLSGLLHLAALSPAAENVLVAALTTLVVGFNLAVVIRLPLRWQVYIVWLEFAALLLVFFYSFNLSFEFIRRKIGFLLRQGLVMTLYISVVSISIASVLALARRRGQAVVQRHRARHRQLLHLVVPRHPAADADLHDLSGAAAARLRGQCGADRHCGAVALLRRLYDRDLPRRHREHPQGPVGGRARARTEACRAPPCGSSCRRPCG